MGGSASAWTTEKLLENGTSISSFALQYYTKYNYEVRCNYVINNIFILVGAVPSTLVTVYSSLEEEETSSIE